MNFDTHANFVVSTVAVAPSPATSGTTLTLYSGSGSIFPTPPFNIVISPNSSGASIASAEICRVTGKTGDVLTIARAQESSTIRSIQVGDIISVAITAKIFQDIENALNSIVNNLPSLITYDNTHHRIGVNNTLPSYGVDTVSVGNGLGALTLGALTGSILFGSNTNVRYTDGAGFQFYNTTTGLWHTLMCIGDPPDIMWDGGQS